MASIPSDKAPKPGLNIYGGMGVNPAKLTIAAEELGIPYNYITLEASNGDAQAEWYASVNPNRRIPAIIHVKEDGTSVTVFESAACLLYIAGEFDRNDKISYPCGTPEYWSQLSWLSWQVAGYGPSMGQATHFLRYASEAVPYGIWRYTAECRRLHHVLNTQLSSSPFLAGDRLTVADIATFTYAYSAKWCGIDIQEYPHVKAWRDRLAQRPGFQRGLQVPGPYQFGDEAVLDPRAQRYYRMVRRFGARMVKSATDEWHGETVSLPSDHANLSDNGRL